MGRRRPTTHDKASGEYFGEPTNELAGWQRRASQLALCGPAARCAARVKQYSPGLVSGNIQQQQHAHTPFCSCLVVVVVAKQNRTEQNQLSQAELRPTRARTHKSTTCLVCLPLHYHYYYYNSALFPPSIFPSIYLFASRSSSSSSSQPGGGSSRLARATPGGPKQPAAHTQSWSVVVRHTDRISNASARNNKREATSSKLLELASPRPPRLRRTADGGRKTISRPLQDSQPASQLSLVPVPLGQPTNQPTHTHIFTKHHHLIAETRANQPNGALV